MFGWLSECEVENVCSFFPPCVKSYHKMSLIFLNGDSLTKASSRHSMVCEAKIQKKNKKTGNQKGVLLEKNTNLLEMQCCKRIWEKRRKKVCVLG